MFKDAAGHLDRVSQRVAAASERMSQLQRVMPMVVQEKIQLMLVADSLGTERAEYRNQAQVDQQLFGGSVDGSHLPLALRAIYQQECMAPPNLATLD